MQTLKIKVEIDLGNSTQMAAAQQFLAALNGTVTPTLVGKQEMAAAPIIPIAGAAPEPPKTEEKPKRKRRTNAEIEADKAAAEAAKNSTPPEEKTDAPKEGATDNGGEAGEATYKIADVRTALSEKVNAHRAAVKAKLSELGAKNVSSMKAEDYPTFMEFLNGLS